MDSIHDHPIRDVHWAPPDVSDILEQVSHERGAHLSRASGFPRYAAAAYLLKNNLPKMAEMVTPGPRPFLVKMGLLPHRASEIQKPIHDSDIALLERLKNYGYLDVLPKLVSMETRYGEGIDHAIVNPISEGDVFMSADRLGNRADAHNLPPTTKTESLQRWLILLHEVSHCVFQRHPQKFTPSAGTCDDHVAVALAHWTFGPLLSAGSNKGMAMLHECFADVYASMMLLESCDHSLETEEVVLNHLTHREETRQKQEQLFLENKGEVTTHPTDLALSKMLAERDQWRGQPPAKLLEHAKRIASDGLMQLCMGPGADVMENLVRDQYRKAMAPPEPSANFMVRWYHISDVNRQEKIASLSKLCDGHPTQEAMHRILGGIEQSNEDFEFSLTAKMAIKLGSKYIATKEVVAHTENMIREASRELLADPQVHSCWKSDRHALENYKWGQPKIACDFKARLLLRRPEDSSPDLSPRSTMGHGA